MQNIILTLIKERCNSFLDRIYTKKNENDPKCHSKRDQYGAFNAKLCGDSITTTLQDINMSHYILLIYKKRLVPELK